MSRELRVFGTIDSLSKEAARFIFEEACRRIKDTGTVDIVLSGGTTPKSCYEYLLAHRKTETTRLEQINWFIGDERWVKPDDPESNERMIRSSLFAGKEEGWGILHSWHACKGSRQKAAKEYGKLFESLFIKEKKGPDILILGLGEDGHTASWFPGSLILHENGELIPLTPEAPENAAAVYIPSKKNWRLSLTPRILNRCALTLFFVTGSKKKEAFRSLIERTDPGMPACWIRGCKNVYFATSDAVDEIFINGKTLPAVIELEE